MYVNMFVNSQDFVVICVCWQSYRLSKQGCVCQCVNVQVNTLYTHVWLPKEKVIYKTDKCQYFILRRERERKWSKWIRVAIT